MIATVSFNTAPFVASLQKFQFELRDKLIVDAARAGGRVIVTAYRTALQARHTHGRSAGSYVSAKASIEHFQAAFQSVGERVLPFQDGNGAYSVVGIVAAPGSWRPIAPQAVFLEGGATGLKQKPPQGSRYQYSTGADTGVVTPQHILARSAESSAQAAHAAFVSKLASGISTYVASH